MIARAPARIRLLSFAAAAVLLLESVALILVLSIRDHVVLPVTVDLPGSAPRVELARLDVGVAAVVVCVLVAAFRLSAAKRPSREIRWIEYSFVSSITVFLVAQLNGIEDLGALVLAYAATSAMTLFTILQDRVAVRRGHPMLPLCFGAAIGIVPWGVIAFHQVGAGFVGPGVAVIVVVITLVMLAFAFAFAATQWRELRSGSAIDGEPVHLVLVSASVSVFAWLVVLGAGW